jgi:hypothetical protein
MSAPTLRTTDLSALSSCLWYGRQTKVSEHVQNRRSVDCQLSTDSRKVVHWALIKIREPEERRGSQTGPLDFNQAIRDIHRVCSSVVGCVVYSFLAKLYANVEGHFRKT